MNCLLLWRRRTYVCIMTVSRNYHNIITITIQSRLWFNRECGVLGTKLLISYLVLSCWFGYTSKCFTSTQGPGQKRSVQLFKSILHIRMSIPNHSGIIKGIVFLVIKTSGSLLYWCWIITTIPILQSKYEYKVS